MMLKNSKEVGERIGKKLQEKAKELIRELDETIEIMDFTIDSIEDIMTRFNSETNQILLDTVSQAIESFDEREIINKKK